MDRRISSTLAVFGVALLCSACQPEDEQPGFWLTGEAAEPAAQDWSSSADVEEIFIETRTWYGVRHSTTIWCVELDGELYIGSYDDDVKYWEKNVARRPEARLRIENRLYDVSVTPVEDRALDQKLDGRYEEKYDMAAVFGDDPPAWRYYHARLRHATD